MASKPTTEALSKIQAAALCPEPDVLIPSRARSASFASAVADLSIGGDPAIKAVRIDPAMSIEESSALS